MKTYFIEQPLEEQAEILAYVARDIETTQSTSGFPRNEDEREDLETDIRLAIKMRNYLQEGSNK